MLQHCAYCAILYCALILPHLTYYVEVCGNNYKTNLISLFATKKAIRVVCKSDFFRSCINLFKNLCTLSLFDLIKLRTVIFMYRVYYNLLPLNLSEHFLHRPSCH